MSKRYQSITFNRKFDVGGTVPECAVECTPSSPPQEEEAQEEGVQEEGVQEEGSRKPAGPRPMSSMRTES